MKYTKAVSATLASALAVGMVPAMAFAADGDDVEMDLQAIDHEVNAQKGSVNAYDTAAQAPMASGNVFTYGSGVDGKTVTALVPKTVKGKYSDDTYTVTQVKYYQLCEETTTNAKSSFDAFQLGDYTLDDKEFWFIGDAVTDASELTPGNWVAISCVDYSTDEGVQSAWVLEGVQFSIVAANIADFEIYEVKADETDLSDESFVWNGLDWGFSSRTANNLLNIKVGDDALEYNEDYTVVLYDENKSPVGKDYVKAAGNYIAKITGIGKYQGTMDFDLNVKALDLDSTSLTFQNALIEQVGGTIPTTVIANGKAIPSGSINIKYDEAGISAAKTYWATISDKDSTNGDIIGTNGRASFDVVKKIIVPALKYDGGTSLEIDRTDAKPKSFDLDELKLTYGETEFSYADGEFSLIVMKADATGAYTIPAQLSDLTNTAVQGNFQVTAKINPANLDEAYKYGGTSSSITVDIDNGEINDASVAYTYGGKLVTSIPTGKIEYSGADVLDSIGITVTVDGKTVTSGYTVEITKKVGTQDVKVEKIVDAGEYKITIKSTTYKVTDTGLTVVVDPAEVAVVWADQKLDTKADVEMFYTGKALNPVAGFTTVVNGVVKAIDVPASAYKLTISEYKKTANGSAVTPVPATITEAGYYTVALEDDATDNYAVAEVATKAIAVSKDAYFTDVPSKAWYAESVYAAYQTGIVNGIEGTKLFAPDKDVTRGDFVCMLYNLAGVKAENGSTGSQTTGWTSFSDVNANAYYAEAVAWAKQAGVANGHNGLFRPGDSMTREEGIAFIANYADACGIDVNVAAADIAAELAKYPDGAKVSGWAEEVVAWACIADVAGNGATINPLGNITRAEAAAMLVNYAGEFAPARLEVVRTATVRPIA